METQSDRAPVTETTAKRNPGVRTGQRRARGTALDMVHSRLLRIAEELGPDARLPRMRALCDELGVSPGTLNLALDKLEQQRVLIRRERSGVFVAPRVRQRNIAVICSPIFFLQGNPSPFWQLLLERIEGIAKEHITRLTVSLSHSFPAHMHEEQGQNPSPLPDYLQSEITSGNFDGIIAIGLPHATTRWMEAQGVPVVAFAGAARFMVSTSRVSLIQEGVRALAELRCSSIEFWLPDSEYWLQESDYIKTEFQRVVARYKSVEGRFILPDALQIKSETVNSPQIETGWQYAFDRLGPGHNIPVRPTGILIPDDMTTLGTLMALPHLHIKLGEDLQIATYTNAGSPVLKGWHSQLCRLEYDLGELVERIYETLEALMDYTGDHADYVPSLSYDLPETPSPERTYEHIRLVRPHLILPTCIRQDA